MTDTQQPQPKRKPTAAAIIIGVVALAAIGIYIAKRKPSAPGGAPAPVTAEGTAIYGMPDAASPVALKALAEPPAPSIVLEVYEPAAVRRALVDNAWFKSVLTEPLGRGFVGSWGAFLGTRGEDVEADFKGLVFDFMADAMLSTPFRVVWFAGPEVTGTPAVVLPNPGGAARGAFKALDAVAGRGTLTLESCISEEHKGKAGVRPLTGVTIRRWLLADHAIYAALVDERLVLGRRPLAVQQGACAVLPEQTVQKGVAFEVAVYSDVLGRDTHVMTMLLGLDTPRLAFGVDNGQIVPRGISAGVVAPGRLGKGKLSDDLLRLIPEEAPVVAALHVNLPKELSRERLTEHFQGKGGASATREVAIIWYPRGTKSAAPQVALVWSNESDRKPLGEIFSGLKLAEKPICKHLALVSSDEMQSYLQRACNGKMPSLLHGPAPVVAGLRQDMSVGLGIHVGRALSRMMMQSFSEEGEAKSAPPEIQEARRQLEALPFVGLRGVVDGKRLVPGGFRS
ncbi:MAG: hypothetical protein HYZ27_03845 [Deltaproteobacteria bacterium]|nr:hypothetical protein [Deltaproteobacteria bacterium]